MVPEIYYLLVTMILKYIMGPVIGSVIGYFTNFLAVKMLFRPKHEVRLFGHRLPFTPGAIPKGKPRLARAVGQVVAGNLVTKENITGKLTSPETKQSVISTIMAHLDDSIKSNVMPLTPSQSSYDVMKKHIADTIAGEVMNALLSVDIAGMITTEGSRIIKEKTRGTMLQMFVRDDLIASMTGPIAQEVVNLIETRGPAFLTDKVSEKLDQYDSTPVTQLLQSFGLTRETLESIICNAYDSIVDKIVDKFLTTLNISQVVEDQINDMTVEELEKLVLSVMKKELDTIVNLGALIGAIIGTINIFI